MGTQALISLVKDGKTFIKVISGCDGKRTEAVTKEIIQYMLVGGNDTKDIYDIAAELKLGCKDCLVVMDKDQIIYRGTEEFSDKLRKNYRETFGDSQINPRIMFESNIERNIGKPENLFIIPVVE